MKKFGVVLFLMILVFAGCSRKPDEELPARVGNLIVNFKVVNNYNLPTNFPATVSIYSDTLHQQLVRDETVTTQSDKVESVEFTDMASQFFYVYVTVGVAGLATPDPDCYMTAFVQLNKTTNTGLITVAVYENRVSCSLD